MSLHDVYARVTPFEIAFPDEEVVERLIRDVDAEASSRGVDPQLPGVFITLGAVADRVRELKAPDAPQEAARQLGALLFHAVHFARSGRPLYLLETAVTRYLVEGSPGGEPRPPEPAGYLQLPQHLFWMPGPDEGPPESIDGLFWFASDAGMLHVLPVTGVLPERMAFRALPLPEVPLGDASEWLEADVREGAPDYSSSLPGHDLDRLHAMETAGEVLKLVARFFAYVDAVPGARERAAPPGSPDRSAAPPRAEPGDSSRPGQGPRPSRLPYSTVKLVA